MLKSEILRKEIRIEHVENYWTTTDGTKLYTQTWIPASRPKAIINLVHGMGEHSSRYQSLAIHFAENGFVVASFDHRGHGKSQGKRGHSSSFQNFLQDLELFLTNSHKSFSGLPIFIYGHSFGGSVVLNYAMLHSLSVKGIVITSPWLELNQKPSSLKMLAVSILSWLLPALELKTGLSPESISRDLRQVHAYRNDPLVHDKITPRMFLQAYEAGLRALHNIYKINVPLLVMHGSADTITSCKATREFVRNASDKTTFVEWPGCFHELHNDLDRDEVYKTLLSWFDRHC